MIAPCAKIECTECHQEIPQDMTSEAGGRIVCWNCADEMTEEPMGIQIEAGKFYKTRIGIKAVIYAVERGGNKPIHGAIFNGTGWDIRAWDVRGNHAPEFSNHHNIDLIAPWADPPVVDWDRFPNHIVAVAMDADGQWSGYTTPDLHTASITWSRTGGFRHDYHLWVSLNSRDYPAFAGDWRDSLAVRPGYEEGK